MGVLDLPTERDYQYCTV